jgi:catechol 2,3-dioxygenase-like lactoylglutathione lyase family enzyme
MIDHVSLPVRDLARAARFYETVLGALGFALLERREATIAFGKTYSEFWINLRVDAEPPSTGAHVCFRARSTDMVDAFHAGALEAGGSSDGAPALRPHHGDGYYAAYIRDPDGNRIEAVTFIK